MVCEVIAYSPGKSIPETANNPKKEAKVMGNKILLK
jgi:hypothetical protein